jgi:hypothetical protein
MSGFSPTWLAMRETADRAARSKDVLAACASAFAKHTHMTICDLGAGTGASLRALAALLPMEQHWILVDVDAANLAAAAEGLSAWADHAETKGGALLLRHGPRKIEVRMQRHDFARAPQCWPAETDLVTASAVFDLTSAAWIEDFVARLAGAKMPLLSMLTANDVIISEPAHALDRTIITAFHAHQTRDKGFGPSAGSAAARILEEALQKAGYTIAADDSPWRLGAAETELRRATVDGMAQAVSETNMVSADDVARWRDHARDTVQHLTIGHRDVFARFI